MREKQAHVFDQQPPLAAQRSWTFRTEDQSQTETNVPFFGIAAWVSFTNTEH